MADFVDEATEFIDLHFEKAIKSIQRVHPVFSGFCLFCGEQISEDRSPARYCDADCRISHEKATGKYKGK